MPDLTYLASVIVPVYNVEKYLSSCLDSLVNQTLDFSKLEIILVNDGSTDSSEEICRHYSEKYKNVFLYSKENEGLSKTRNYGLDMAHGKYIFYLDSDDSLRSDTIEAVTSYFDTVYDETDLVTYRIIQYFQGRPTVVHFRYMTLKKSGVYDLNKEENRFITQTNINICVKNLGQNNIKFDTTQSFRHEDEKYCCEVLKRKMTIGFCNKGEYIYNRNNIDSIVSTQFSPEKIFNSSMDFYEELFDSFGKKIPAYYQGIVFNDFRWKLMDKKFLPVHLDGDEWLEANRRIDRLLGRMDADTIILHPSVSENHLHYWLRRHRKSHTSVVMCENGALICSDGKRICTVRKIHCKIKQDENGIKAELVSPVFYHLNGERFSIYADGKKADYTFNNNYLSKNFNPDGTYPELTVESENTNISVLIDGIEIPCIRN